MITALRSRLRRNRATVRLDSNRARICGAGWLVYPARRIVKRSMRQSGAGETKVARSSPRRRRETAKPGAPTTVVSARAEHLGAEQKAMFDAVAAAPQPPEIEAQDEGQERWRLAVCQAPRESDRRS